MGTKYDSKSKSWVAFYSKRHPITRIPKTLRRYKLKSEAEAKRIEKDLIVAVDKALNETVTPTWGKMVQDYIQSKSLSDWMLKTQQDARLNLESYTFEKWRFRKVSSINSTDIRTLVEEVVGDKSVGTKQTLVKFIRGAFQYALDSGYLTSNPTPNIRFKKGDKIKRVLTEDQAAKLLNMAKLYESDWYYHWVLALYTGLRNGELYALKWNKVNFEQRTILVDTAWNKVDGFKSTKSGNDRIVEMAPDLVTTLKELKLKSNDPDFVLMRSRNWEKGEQARILRMFLQGIGLPPVRFHDLRASWATIMLGRGIEPIKVMNMGGWTSLKTMQIYIRKAGVNIKGITDTLSLHNPSTQDATVFSLSGQDRQS